MNARFPFGSVILNLFVLRTTFYDSHRITLRAASLTTFYSSSETLPLIAPQSSHLSIRYYHRDLH